MRLLKKITNFVLIYFFILNKKFAGNKIILFHHPSYKLIDNTDIYTKYLFSNLKKNYQLINTHELVSLHKKNYFYISQGFLKFIFGIDFFISAYVCDHFTPNSKKIYIHHDIYDTPLAEKKKYLNIVTKIAKYNFIFVSSDITKKFFQNNFKKYSIRNFPEVITTGYIKFDFLLRKLKYLKKKSRTIVIGPTNYNSYKKSLLIKNLDYLINNLLEKRKFKIVLRPHPSNINDALIKNIEKKFSNNKNFKVNFDKNYLNLYYNSLCLITDILGTAYTYSFLTKNPVIFFDYLRNNTEKSFFFNDRRKIGFICSTTNSTLLKINKIIRNKNLFKKKINKLKKNRLYNLRKVKQNMIKFIYSN